MAGEQSSGTFVPVPGETPGAQGALSRPRRKLWKYLAEADEPSLPGSGAPREGGRRQRARATLSWPLDNIGPSLPNLWRPSPATCSSSSNSRVCAFSTCGLPDAFASAYPGPKFGVEGTRKLTGVQRTPVDRHHRQAVDRLHARADGRACGCVVRGRHRLHQGRRTAVGWRAYAPFDERVRAVMRVIDRHARAQRPEGHVRVQPHGRDRRDAPAP